MMPDWTTSNSLDAELKSGSDVIKLRKIIRGFYGFSKNVKDLDQFTESETEYVYAENTVKN